MAEVWRPTLADFIEAAAVILETEPEQIERLPGLGLADSALEAPVAGFGDADAYPALLDQATVLITHLAPNHPLPDGNKRVSLALAILFLERNASKWGEPAHDRDVAMVERIAGGGRHAREDPRLDPGTHELTHSQQRPEGHLRSEPHTAYRRDRHSRRP